MPQNGFSVGRDISLDIIGPNGPLQLSLITDFSRRPVTTDQKVKGLDGITRHVRFPDGWAGKLSIERQDSTLDDYFAQLEDNFYNGLSESPLTITETITEVSGAVSQYRYVGVLLTFEDAGDWKGDSTVKQSVGFVAARRVKVS